MKDKVDYHTHVHTAYQYFDIHKQLEKVEEHKLDYRIFLNKTDNNYEQLSTVNLPDFN